MSFIEENFKFKQIYCDIPTGFGEVSQRYIDLIGMDDSISTSGEKLVDNVDDILQMEVGNITKDLPDYRRLAMLSKEAKSLLGEVVFDESSCRYRLEAIVTDNPEMTIYQSSDGFLIYVYKAFPEQREEYTKAFDYLMRYVNVQRVVLPITILDEPYIGYVASKLSGYMTLEEHLMSYLVDEEGFDHYYKETDGLFKRYEIAGYMAKFLEEIHRDGYFIGDILPTEILVSPKKNSIVFMNANRLMRLPRHDYSETEKLFVAPELQNRCWRFDSLTDTYALSKIIRFMLFPVLKKDVPAGIIKEFGEEKVAAILLASAQMDDRYERHSLLEIRDACFIAAKRLYRCHHCHGWILAHLDSEEKCPWCHSEVSQLAGAKFFEYTVSGDIVPENQGVKSYVSEIGEMIFKLGKQIIDYRQLTNGSVDTLQKLPIASIYYYPDGSITLVNLTEDMLFHTYMDGGNKKTEWIKPKTDREVEVDVYRGKSRIFYKEEDLSQHGFEKTKVYQFFTIH